MTGRPLIPTPGAPKSPRPLRLRGDIQRLAWLSFLLSLLTWPAAAQQPRRADLPVTPDEFVLPDGGVKVPMIRHMAWAVIEAEINGRGPYQFIVDTGAPGLLIHSEIAESLGLPTGGPDGLAVRVAGPGGSGNSASLHQIDSLKIGSAELRGLPALATKLPFGGDLAGVLGMGVFRELLLTLDYPRSEFRIERGELPPPDGRDVLEMQTNPRGSHPQVMVQLCGREVEFTLDTGLMGWLRLPSDVSGYCQFETGPAAGPPARTVDREIPSEVARLAGSLQIGRHEIDRPHGLLDGQPHAPLIGGYILSQFSLTLDITNQRLRLSREGTAPITPPAFRVLGFKTISTAQGEVVWGVMPGSPAAEAGLVNDAVVIELNGKPMQEWQRDGRMEELLKQDTVKVKFQQGDSEAKVVAFKVMELLPAAK